MDPNAQSTATGIDALKQHVIANKIDVGLWCTRGLTIFFSFFYVLPIFWSPYNLYYKALAAYAAASALRLHQRQPFFSISRHYFASILLEDSCHYLFYSMIFLYVAPFTLVLIPIFCFSFIHFSSYTLRLLDILGPNSMWMARLFISLIEFNARSILDFIALTEIILMPFSVFLVFIGRASLLTPFMYYQFLSMRYKSQRNPSTRKMFFKLRYLAENLAQNSKTPGVIKNLINTSINFVCWMAPVVPQSQ